MTEKVQSQRFFHVTRYLPHNCNNPLSVGSQIISGQKSNPFFGFYEGQQDYEITTPNGPIRIKAIRFLAAVKNGEIQSNVAPQIAHDVAQHYLMLARELIMEEVRYKISHELPSRQTCIWMADTKDQARYWQSRLSGPSAIATLDVNGKIHRADASLLLGDSEPLSETYARANRYWRGDMSETPEEEVLFSGTATVVEIL